MNREKQIIEIKECIDAVYGADCAYFDVDGFAIANEIYNAGYRKSTDLAEEIFAETRKELVRYLMLNENIAIKCKDENGEWNAEYWKGKLSAFKQIQGFIDTELKKKYTEEGK